MSEVSGLFRSLNDIAIDSIMLRFAYDFWDDVIELAKAEGGLSGPLSDEELAVFVIEVDRKFRKNFPRLLITGIQPHDHEAGINPDGIAFSVEIQKASEKEGEK